MKKVFLFSLVVLLSCKINAVSLDVAHNKSYNEYSNFLANEKASTDPVVKVS